MVPQSVVIIETLASVITSDFRNAASGEGLSFINWRSTFVFKPTLRFRPSSNSIPGCNAVPSFCTAAPNILAIGVLRTGTIWAESQILLKRH